MRKKKNIIFIPGIVTYYWMLKNWRKELNKKFPNDDIYFIDEFYFYTQKEKLDKIIEKILKILDNNQDTYIIAHSFGGILATSVYFKNNHHNIKKIIMMGSPVSYKAFWLREIKEYLGFDKKIDKKIEIKTYGGYFDLIVLNKYSFFDKKNHKSFFCGHKSFLFNKRIIKKILKENFNF